MFRILTTVILLFGFSCKARVPNNYGLDGVDGRSTSKEIDYEALFANRTTPVVVTYIFAFADSYKPDRSRNSPAGNDQGTDAAFKFVNWLKKQNATTTGESAGLFANGVEESKTHVLPPRETMVYGGIYRYQAIARDVAVQYQSGGETKTGKLDFSIRVVLAAAIDNSVGNRMPDDFMDLLADAMVNSDVLSYNGHIWTTQPVGFLNPGQPMMVDANTYGLASTIKEIIAKRGSPKPYGVLFMNACNGEEIETVLMQALYPTAAKEVKQPILLSHRNYSNYGHFQKQLSFLTGNLIHGQALAKVMLDLTTTRQGSEALEYDAPGDPKPAVQKLNAYYQSAQMQNPKTMVIVAYDITGGAGETAIGN